MIYLGRTIRGIIQEVEVKRLLQDIEPGLIMRGDNPEKADALNRFIKSYINQHKLRDHELSGGEENLNSNFVKKFARIKLVMTKGKVHDLFLVISCRAR